MYNWTNDIPPDKNTKQRFIEALELLKPLVRPRILEVGSFAGTSIATMSEMFPNAECVAIDNWGLDKEELRSCRDFFKRNIEMSEVREAFFKNTKGKVRLIEKDSALALCELIQQGSYFDFIYVDGSHEAGDALMDITLSWTLLSSNGILAIDDYLYEYPPNPEKRVKAATDFFMKKFAGEFTVLHSGYRIFLQKNFA